MSASPQFAFVTLVTTDNYLPGALVVAAALRDVHPSPPTSPQELDPSEFHIACLVTPETVDVSTVKLLRRAFDLVIGVEVIEEDTEEGLNLLGRPDLRTVLTKLHIFRLTSYRKLIFLDADVLPLRSLSHLFRIPSNFAAVPDVGWPDIFNSGFLVFEPGEDKFSEVMSVVKSKGSWDGGDQGVLNEWKKNDWEHLSFTYNTTPTAAYTYAPAYKRFGDMIRNIHFIGPNKPWSQIPFRQPGVSSTESPASGSSQVFTPPPSYAFPALLDRWFAVYDKHYRSPAAPPAFRAIAAEIAPASSSAGEFAVQRYESVWDSDARPSIGTEIAEAGAPLGLDELRRLAIEGLGGSATAEGEGTYRSLPLEGRVDLMRPPKPPPAAAEKAKPAAPIVQIQVPEVPHTPTRERSPAPMTTLPTPGPNEFPPTPVFRGHSLPPETPTHMRSVSPASLQPEYRDHEHLDVYSPHHTPTHSPSSSRSASPQRLASPQRPASPRRPASPPLLSWNPAIESPPTSAPPVSQFPEQTYFPNVWDAPTPSGHPPKESDNFFPLPPPPAIPEMLIQQGLYKAVIGEPKHEDKQHHQPPQSHAPEQHRPSQPFTEHPRPETHRERPRHHRPAPPPPPHHHPSPPSHPQPDRSKIGTVFPWEEKPRHAPARVFPRTDSPPPGKPFIEPTPPPPTLNLDLRPPSPPPPPPPPPVHGFPRTTTYANAWDAIPSIQRYASRLVGPPVGVASSFTPPLSTSPAWPGVGTGGKARKGSAATASVGGGGGGDEYRSWQDPVEVSSRDADDEDEDDEEDGDRLGYRNSPNASSGGTEPERSDGFEKRRPPLRKRYKVKAVQTIPKEVRHQAVQADPSRGRSGRSRSKGDLTKGVQSERASPPAFTRGLPQHMRVFEQTASGSPAVNAPGFMLPLPPPPADEGAPRQPQRGQVVVSPDEGQQPLPSGALSPRLHDEYAFGSIPRKTVESAPATIPLLPKDKLLETPELSPPVPGAPTAATTAAAGAIDKSALGTESVASPPSSLGPTSPPEGAPVTPPLGSLSAQKSMAPEPQSQPRPAGRTFDPARGVDVFKRGSEEVLARFLKMDSWEEDSPSPPAR